VSAPTDAEQRYTAWALRLALAVVADSPDACCDTVAEIDASDGCWRLITGVLLFTLEQALDESHEGHGVEWVQAQLIARLDGEAL
jgi:hypothetical protein